MQQYLDFDLQIEEADGGLISRVLRAPGGQASVNVALPFSHDELRSFWQKLDEPPSDNRDQLEEQQEIARTIGTRLYEAILPGEIDGAFHRSLNAAYEARARLRVRLQLKNVESWSALPWEYLYNPTNREFMTLSVNSLMNRYIDLLHRIRPFPVKRPFRLLVAITSPNTHVDLNVEQEWYNLVDTLDHLALDGKLVVELLREPTLVGLQRQLRQKEYHAFHYIGYGTRDPVTGDGLLLFENKMGRLHPLNGQHLARLLRDHYSLRLATVNSRSDGREDHTLTGHNPFMHVAQNMVHHGMPAALAFRYETSPISSLRFLDEFYTAIADYAPVDMAVSAARRAARAEDRGAGWGSPALFSRIADNVIYHDLETGPLPTPADELPSPTESLRLKYS